MNNRLYRHKVVRINYTTYDMRRSQDSLNPRTQADVIVLANDEPHREESNSTCTTSPASDTPPYWYARVLGVFHTHIRYRNAATQPSQLCSINFLWVRWFEPDAMYSSGWPARHLHRLRFPNCGDMEAFGFISPADVVRAAHLIPTFAQGRSIMLPPSLARPIRPHEDWRFHYINM